MEASIRRRWIAADRADNARVTGDSKNKSTGDGSMRNSPLSSSQLISSLLLSIILMMALP
jgi:hypothetical protein